MDLNFPSWLIFAIGFLAQLFFTARTLIQWFDSEKSKHIESPAGYWIFSVLGSWIMFFYGVLRNDFAIILGQIISYYVYLWNLSAKGIWKRMAPAIRLVLVATPVAAVILLHNTVELFRNLFSNSEIPAWLLLFGSAGQIIFTLRFVYQWIYSRRRKVSALPLGFWIISLAGSSAIIAYGVFRKDPVLILGQSFGIVAYIRNLMIGVREKDGAKDGSSGAKDSSSAEKDSSSAEKDSSSGAKDGSMRAGTITEDRQ